MPIPGSNVTALCLSVMGNRISTALLLLANSADPYLRQEGYARGMPTIVHMACALGRAELTEQFLASQHIENDPTELLAFYQLRCPSDVPNLARALVRHGAEVSDDLFHAFLCASRWLSAWELLESPTFSDHLTASQASNMLLVVWSSCGGSQTTNHQRQLRAYYNTSLTGAPIPTWAGASGPEAGMDVRPAPKTRRRKLPAKYEIDDLLGDTSPYDKSQDDKGAAAQLAVIRLLLQHGAPIGGATRGDALDSYPLVPGEYGGRVGVFFVLSEELRLAMCQPVWQGSQVQQHMEEFDDDYDYADKTIEQLGAILRRRSPARSQDVPQVHHHQQDIQLLYLGLLSQEEGKGGRKKKGVEKVSPLGTIWKQFLLVYARDVGEKPDAKLCRKARKARRLLPRPAAISRALRDPRVGELELVHEFYDASSLTSRVDVSKGILVNL
ncbi:hypothetical protein SAPIO_CDS7875 [Scedosporium apiospermum]|uniref:Uncharacterized protein n=1 Tax=Pseudallescheria apiosperma TaxID=563466 RepID=A0A084G0V7_PSEDA|nr:uncharacterized protein SAPIO_CDS7875 [Scedosporium apiospermum]KEZ40969.1 hypothetical protein SAPIO_CDS7875 [Scedosporium apiospermum]